MKVIHSLFIMVLFLSFMLTACSKSGTDNMQIPEYPGAKADQKHTAEVLGMNLASVRRVTTSDSFNTVLTFYKESLAEYNPEIMSYTLDDGRQASITITENEKHFETVVIQEFKTERLTAISYMKAEF